MDFSKMSPKQILALQFSDPSAYNEYLKEKGALTPGQQMMDTAGMLGTKTPTSAPDQAPNDQQQQISNIESMKQQMLSRLPTKSAQMPQAPTPQPVAPSLGSQNSQENQLDPQEMKYIQSEVKDMTSDDPSNYEQALKDRIKQIVQSRKQ